MSGTKTLLSVAKVALRDAAAVSFGKGCLDRIVGSEAPAGVRIAAAVSTATAAELLNSPVNSHGSVVSAVLLTTAMHEVLEAALPSSDREAMKAFDKVMDAVKVDEAQLNKLSRIGEAEAIAKGIIANNIKKDGKNNHHVGPEEGSGTVEDNAKKAAEAVTSTPVTGMPTHKGVALSEAGLRAMGKKAQVSCPGCGIAKKAQLFFKGGNVKNDMNIFDAQGVVADVTLTGGKTTSTLDHHGHCVCRVCLDKLLSARSAKVGVANNTKVGTVQSNSGSRELTPEEHLAEANKVREGLLAERDEIKKNLAEMSVIPGVDTSGLNEELTKADADIAYVDAQIAQMEADIKAAKTDNTAVKKAIEVKMKELTNHMASVQRSIDEGLKRGGGFNPAPLEDFLTKAKAEVAALEAQLKSL